jgi:hypothetical protein
LALRVIALSRHVRIPHFLRLHEPFHSPHEADSPGAQPGLTDSRRLGPRCGNSICKRGCDTVRATNFASPTCVRPDRALALLSQSLDQAGS